MGLLSGKYRKGGAGRLSQDASGGGLGLFTPRNTAIVTVLEDVAEAEGRSMAQVALNWACNRPGIAAAIIGASRVPQIVDNLAALDFTLAPEHVAALDAASAPDVPYPYSLFADDYQAGILNTGTGIGDKPPGYAPPLLMPKTGDYAFGAGEMDGD